MVVDNILLAELVGSGILVNLYGNQYIIYYPDLGQRDFSLFSLVCEAIRYPVSCVKCLSHIALPNLQLLLS
jgi:hypothetical protein